MPKTKLSMFLNKHVVSFIIVMSQINLSFIYLENEKEVENTSDGNDYEYNENSYDDGYSVDEEEEEEVEEWEVEEEVGSPIIAVTCDSCYSKVIQKDLI